MLSEQQDVASPDVTFTLSVHLPSGVSSRLIRFSGGESLSRLYAYNLEVVTDQEAIDPNTMLGKGVPWGVERGTGDERQFHGIIRQFVRGESWAWARGWWVYYVEVVPKL